VLNTHNVNRNSGKWNQPDNPDTHASVQPRRIGTIVRDDRGSASVEWRQAPGDFERQKFEIERGTASGRGDSKLRRGFEPRIELEREPESFNPYDHKPVPGSAPAAPAAKGGKRDLKKLSEWLKLMKAMEERKKNGDSSED
jgi:hypothetical protein